MNTLLDEFLELKEIVRPFKGLEKTIIGCLLIWIGLTLLITWITLKIIEFPKRGMTEIAIG